MKFLMTVASASFLALAGLAPPHAASAADDGQRLHIAAGSDSSNTPNPTAESQSDYKTQARSDMQAWKRKVRDFTESAKEKGSEASDAASAGLDKAWRKTVRASHRLQTASADGWDQAKAAYEKAVDDLKTAWRKVKPDSQ